MVSFDGIPFSVVEEKILHCQYGQHYFKKRIPLSEHNPQDKRSKRLRLQGTRKIGCSAKVCIKKYALYPEYKVLDDSTSGTTREIKQRKQDTLSALKCSLSTDFSNVKTLFRYFISLPSENAHSKHPIGEVGGFAQKLHPLMSVKISEMVSAGITNVTDIKRSLKWYVQHDLKDELGDIPKSTDRSFYPTDNDIRNHVYIAKKATEFSKLDQEQLQCKLKKWKETFPNQNAFYRPCLQVKEEHPNPEIASSSSDSKVISQNCQIFDGNSGIENMCTSSTTSLVDSSQNFLLVLQDEWQKKLLERYGNTICLIDATYKTTQYDLPLYFICVKTNVGYIIVAEFIVQSEEHENIQEALEVLKSWNPNWCPPFFMCDYSEAELLALEGAFCNVTVYLCDFHREQCWERWVKIKQNASDGISKDEGNSLLCFLRSCALAPPCIEEDSSVDKYYQEAVEHLKQSNVWKTHKSVQLWLETKWLNIPKVRS